MVKKQRSLFSLSKDIAYDSFIECLDQITAQLRRTQKRESSKKSKPKPSRKRKAGDSGEPSGSSKRARPNASDPASIYAAQPAPEPPSQPSAAAVQPAVLLQEFLCGLPSLLSLPSPRSPLLRAVALPQHSGQVPGSSMRLMRHLLCPETLSEQRKLEKRSRQSLKHSF